MKKAALILVVLIAVLVSSCFSSVESGKVATKGVSSEKVATAEPTATEKVEPTSTNTPTAVPSPTNTPEPTVTVTQKPTVTPETYGREVIWLDGEKMEKNLEAIKKSIHDKLSPLDGFTITLKDPVVDVRNLPTGETCYGWEAEEGSISCLYAREGVNYYCDPDPNGWPVCFPEDYVPRPGRNEIDKFLLVLYEGLGRLTVKSDIVDLTTSEMRVAEQDEDLILAFADEPTVEYYRCAPENVTIYGEPVKNSSIVFYVPLPQYTGISPIEEANIKIFTSKFKCD